MKKFILITAMMVFPSSYAYASCALSSTFINLCSALSLGMGPCNDTKDMIDTLCDEMDVMQQGMNELSEMGGIVSDELYKGTKVGTSTVINDTFWVKETENKLDTIKTMGQDVNSQFLNLGSKLAGLEASLESATTKAETDSLSATFVGEVNDMLSDGLVAASDINDRITDTKSEICVDYTFSSWSDYCYNVP